MRLPSWAQRVALAGSAALIFLGGTRTFLVQGLFLPVRVAGGSMAPCLLGSHGYYECEHCGYRFAFGTEFPPDEVAIVCSNCGTIEKSFVAAARGCAGQRVLVDRLSLRWRTPRRWEVVAFRRHDGALVVKRVLGLPTEEVRLRDGDVYVAGQILRKPWRIAQTQAVTVHRDRCRGSQPRWRPERLASKWRTRGQGYQYRAEGGKPASDFDYLIYHHLACLPPPAGNAPAPVWDSYGYNQSLSRALSRVTDLILEARVRWHGSGAINLRLLAGQDLYELRWQPSAGRLELQRGADLLDSGGSTPLADRGTARIVFAFVDRQVLFLINEKTVLQHTVATSEVKIANRESLPWQRPVAIGVRGFSLIELSDLRIARDVYYVDAAGAASTWRLGDREFLLLGDNSPISQDARQGKEYGIVTADRIVGRLVPQHTRWLDGKVED